MENMEFYTIDSSATAEIIERNQDLLLMHIMLKVKKKQKKKLNK